MAKTLEDILKIPECRCLRIVAGRNGLTGLIRWTAAIEVIETIKFSNEGDLNFVTGLAISSEEDFLSIVTKAHKHKLVGIVFALGPYIKDIPKCVIDYGNLHRFPIFTMPWEVKISTLSHDIGEFISADPGNARIPMDLLKSILKNKEDAKLNPEIRIKLSELGFSEQFQYRVLLFRIFPKSEAAEEKGKEIRQQLVKGIRRLYYDEPIVQIDEELIVILRSQGHLKELEQRKIKEISDLAVKTQIFFDDHNIQIGIGSLHNDIERISHSYREALLVTNLMSAEDQYRKSLFSYDQLGAYKIIWEGRASEIMIKFAEETLGALKIHDEINDTDLMKFLSAYFKYNGSIKELGENLFIHKNTVLYKLRKIEGILGCSFSQLESELNMKLAFMIEEVLAIESR